MKISIGSILDIIAIVLLVIVSISIISINASTQSARNFHSQAINEIENCNFSDGVIGALVADAQELGFELSVDKYSINDSAVAEVELNYKYDIPFFDIINTPQTIRGTAR